MPPGSLYKDVKRKFLKIAMTNHPDTHAEDLTEEEREKMRDIFIEARIAFELLTEDDDGTAILLSEKEEEDKMENFDSWFKHETGFSTPFQFDIDPETMKEVAKMTEAIGGDSGLDRDGGMWALARMVTSAVKTGGDAAAILRLEAGNDKDRHSGASGSELRRRRKR
jgi:DnaJ-class molecular chaperone